MVRATLKLENGVEFHGYSFGYEGISEGETVFSTAMAGYTESLTDPSSAGKILCMTYPIAGCYGVPEPKFDENGLIANMESSKVRVNGLVVSDYSEEYSHWTAAKSLGAWLKENKVPAITGIDTRELTRILRDCGTMKGRIVVEGATETVGTDLADLFSCNEPVVYGKADKKVVMVDCGVSSSLLRSVIARGVEVVRVPSDYDFSTLEYDGIILSDGPECHESFAFTIEHIKTALNEDKPILGIALGHQLLALAAGARVDRLKCGHRSHNQPVRLSDTNKCFITTQNHGYCVDEKSLPTDWTRTFVNMNDASTEGIAHKSGKFFSVQFMPDLNGAGTSYLIDEFIGKL